MNKRHSFISFIDRFSKHAVVLCLEDGNSVTIAHKIRLSFSIKGKPNLLILDNEFNSINVKEFLRLEGTQYTKPNSHTGNSDIERLRSTIGEKLIVLEIDKSELPIQERLFKCVEWYNRSIHSAIKAKPVDVMLGKQYISKLLKEGKENIINKRNENREIYRRTHEKGYVKNYKALRYKDEPKYRKLKLENIHPLNIKRRTKFPDQIDTKDYDRIDRE